MAPAAQDQHTVPAAPGGDREQSFMSGMSEMSSSRAMEEINRVVASLEHEIKRLRVEVAALDGQVNEIGGIRLETDAMSKEVERMRLQEESKAGEDCEKM